MSAVINQTKQLYRKTLSLELIAFCVLTVVIALWLEKNSAFSFIAGCFASFLPHCLFVYWMFFRNTSINTHKMSVFYQGEGLKWLATIILIVAFFKFYAAMNYISFFIGYFFILLFNSLLPVFLKVRAK
ncbi:ATP synthase subunit I [Glaesserella sp.]|uniref:ATP synthase subunit I n=1 Tax=Glaesserella sp. TaxID=2094731 RepID=UPI00359FB48A